MPIPSGPTAAGLVSPERLGRWRREAGAEAAALAAAARSACAQASSSEAQARAQPRAGAFSATALVFYCEQTGRRGNEACRQHTESKCFGWQELAALWCAADEAPGFSRSMREAAAAIESIFVAAPGRVNVVMNPAPAMDPRDSAENWEELGALSGDEDCVRVRARRPSQGIRQ